MTQQSETLPNGQNGPKRYKIVENEWKAWHTHDFPFLKIGLQIMIFLYFSKLPTNYPPKEKIFIKQSKIRRNARIFGKKNTLFVEYVFDFLGKFLVILKTVKNYNLQAYF